MNSISYFSCWIYILIGVFFLNQIHKCSNVNSSKIGNLCFTIIYLFAIFRYQIGYDYNGYWDNVSSAYSNREDFEALPTLIFDFVRKIGFPPLVFIIFSTISLFSYKKVISKYSTNQALSWYFYFTYPMLFIQDCSTIRQSAAMGMFFLTYMFVEDKKWWHSFVCIILASLFHNSGIACASLLFLPLIKKVDFKLNVIFLIFSFFAGKFLLTFITNYLGGFAIAQRFLYYTDMELDGFNIFQYLMYGIDIINLMLIKRLGADNPKNYLYITLVNAGLCLFNLFQFETQTATRLCGFFMLFQLLIFPSYIPVLRKFLQNKKAAINILFVAMISLQLMMVFTYTKAYNTKQLDRGVYVPYRTWIFQQW